MAATPVLAIPYPVGTDRVMDGDNAMQAIAERVEARLPRGWVAAGDYRSSSGYTQAYVVPVTLPAVLLRTGRRYKITGFAVFQRTDANGANTALIFQRAGAPFAQTSITTTTTDPTGLHLTAYLDGDGVASDLVIALARATGPSSIQCYGGPTQPGAVFMVEDVGPTSLA